jgi:hypothetical protein
MALSAFDDKAHQPAPADLESVLGRSFGHWKQMVAHLEAEYAPLDQTWNFAGAKWGWSLRLKRKKRTILYMTPGRKRFLAGIVLGEKAVRAARARGLPKPVLDAIAEAPRYAEGRGVRIAVRTRADREGVLALAAVKMEN